MSNSTNVGQIDLSLILNSDKFSSQLKNVDGQANTASSKISASLSKIGKAVAVAFSVTKIIQFGKACIDTATETSNAWIGLNSILTGQGKSFSQAKSFINDYISDGLVPLNNAISAYKNLSLRGYNSEQIEKTMNALKNSATFARQSTYSLGEAVQTATEGLKNENSVVVDNAGVTKNVAKMWEDYAKSIGKTTNNLTQQEKIQAEVNGILEETKFQSNDAAIYTKTYAYTVAKMNTAFTNMKIAIGNVVQPIAKLFVPVITLAVNAVTKLFNALAGLLSLFGLKADSVETVSNGIGGIADNAENASNSVSDIGDSATGTAKKIKKVIAPFDEISKLDSNSDSSGGSGSTGGVDLGNIGDSINFSSTIEQDSTAFDNIISKAKELFSIFKEGFSISFGETNFDGILDHILNIKDALIDIWTDSDVINSAQQWGDTFLYSLGQVTGSIGRIGVNISEGLIGSIDKYLSQNTDRIKSFICRMFDISSEDIALTGNLWQALGEISDVFSGDTAKQIGTDIISMFANPFMSVVELCSKFAVDLRATLVQPIIDNTEKIKETFNNILGPIQKVTGTLAEAGTYIGDKWNEVYDEHIHPLMESLKTGLSDTFGKFLDVYNEYMVPFLENMANGIGTLWEEHLKPLVDKIGEFISSVAEGLQSLWETILKPVVDWIIQNVIPAVVPVLESIWNTIKNVFGSIADTIGGIIDKLKGFIDFIVGIFTGDWEKAWNGIKTFFTGIWEAISGFFGTILETIKGIVDIQITAIKAKLDIALTAMKDIFSNIWNGIKDTISSIWEKIKTSISDAVTNIKNKVVNTFQSVYDKIKSIFSGIATFFTGIWDKVKNTFSNLGTKIGESISGAVKAGINGLLGMIENIVNGFIRMINGAISVINAIPGVSISPLNTLEIPRLATGGYVKANTPQLAVIGDNKKEGEIVSPESKMYDVVSSAIKDNMPSDGSNDGDVVVNIYLDNELIERKKIKKHDLKALATNGRY